MDRNLRAKIRQLCSYITDKSAVMQYINRERNLNLTLRDIEAACIGQRDYRPNLTPMIPSPLIVTRLPRSTTFDTLRIQNCWMNREAPRGTVPFCANVPGSPAGIATRGEMD